MGVAWPAFLAVRGKRCNKNDDHASECGGPEGLCVLQVVAETDVIMKSGDDEWKRRAVAKGCEKPGGSRDASNVVSNEHSQKKTGCKL